MGKQSALSESAINSLIVALKGEDNDVRRSAAETLGNQSTLSESAIHSLIVAIKDKGWNVSNSAASALAKQSTLSVSVIQSLIASLKDKVVRDSVNQAFLATLRFDPLFSVFLIPSQYS
ncbi:hypothetical protein FBU30_010608 [Linnemannia zychae]|nr:hypothetical protein FBU30_010608 [Linnemannia zychae]